MVQRRATDDNAARAVERVLRAEREADLEMERCRAEAQAMLEAAREQARTDVNHALQRVTRWQQAHARALDVRLAALRARDAQQAAAQPVPDETAIVAAVERVVDRLTGVPVGAGPSARIDQAQGRADGNARRGSDEPPH